MACFEGEVISENGTGINDIFRLHDDGISFECALVRQSTLGICNQGIGTDEAAVFGEGFCRAGFEIHMRIKNRVCLAIYGNRGGF